MMDIRKQAELEEGREHKAYPDRLTGGAPWTIGVGHTGPEVHEGLVWTDAQIDEALTADLWTAMSTAYRVFPWVRQLNERRQAVLILMLFQMGLHRVPGFAKALDWMSRGQYANAGVEMLDSTWARQTPARAKRMAEQMKTGEWCTATS